MEYITRSADPSGVMPCNAVQACGKHLDVVLSVLNLVCTLQGVVDALHERGNTVAGVQALVRVHLACHIGVSGHLQPRCYDLAT